MAEKKPPVIGTAAIAWRDAFRAIEAMPVVAGIAFALHLVMSLALSAFNAEWYALVGSPWFSIISTGAGIVQAALLAPLAIAVHRFVILGEKTNHYPLEPKSSRYQRFVGFSILVKFLWLIPSTLQDLFPARDSVLGIVVFVLGITAIIMVVRRAILFPAIAIDAPGATWSKARLDTKGSSWRVAFIFVLTALPVLIINLLLAWLWYLPMSQGQPSAGSFLFFSVILTAVAIAAVCAFAAAASHIYQARANSMTQSG